MHLVIWISCLFIPILASNKETKLRINGKVDKDWKFVRDLFEDNFLQDRDLGASVAIYYQGKLVVDLWGGWFNESKTKPYTKDTLQMIFSTTKGIVATAVALCVQRGLLSYSEKVTKYWPEYGQNGKENTTVADVLSHRAGIPFLSATPEQTRNWSAMIRAIESLTPLWPPGTAFGYHAGTFGFIAGELVRRVDPKKRTLGQFVRDEIAVPLDVELYIGLPSQYIDRVSPVGVKSNATFDGYAAYNFWNDPLTWQAELPGGNGISNTRSLAKMYASLIGNVDCKNGDRLLNENILQQATTSNTRPGELDFFLRLPGTFAMGYILLQSFFPYLAPDVFGHSGKVCSFTSVVRETSLILGFGGSIALAIPSKGFSFAYVVNRLSPALTAVDIRYDIILRQIATKLDQSG